MMDRRTAVIIFGLLAIAGLWRYIHSIRSRLTGTLTSFLLRSCFTRPEAVIGSDHTTSAEQYEQQGLIPGDSGLEHCNDGLDPIDDVYGFSHLFVYPQKPRAYVHLGYAPAALGEC